MNRPSIFSSLGTRHSSLLLALFAPWLVGLFSLGLCSCYKAERSNPLDGQAAQLFVPQVLSPSGGEQWFASTTQHIRWKPAEQVIDSVVTLQLVSDQDLNGSGGGRRPLPYLYVIAENIPNTGHFTWAVPNLSSRSCRIRVVTRRGQAESEGTFRISPPPVLNQFPIRGEGREPTALRDLVVFTSNRGGSDDLWMINLRTGDLTQLTNAPGFDGQADWFRPNGNLLAFTSDRSGQKDIWLLNMSQLPPRPIRLTTTGGEQPTWQSSFLHYPSLAYVAADPSQPGLSQILAVTLAIPTTVIDTLSDPVPPFTSVRLTRTRFNLSSRTNIQSPSWGLPGSVNDNVLVYETRSTESFSTFPALWALEFSTIAMEAVSLSRFTTPPGLPATHPSFSPSGARVAFSALGNLWVKSLAGVSALQLTYDDAEDDFPGWATETTIVFQRRPTPNSPWELWTVEVVE
ncbi:MAG: PD40 domain-containing protein [Candidatus Latescibacteria bacterium]|nr:PD40 domain-containing protein [Candidatus Latescibacterota bacterium]